MPTSPDTIFFSDGSSMRKDPSTGNIKIYNSSGTVIFTLSTAAGNLTLAGIISSMASISSAGSFGVPLVVACPAVSAGNVIAKTNFINYTPQNTASVYRVNVMVNVTAWTTPSSFSVIVTYKDSNGSAQSETFALNQGVGTTTNAITAVDRYYGIPLLIAIDNSATAIAVSTTGSFTGSPVYTIAAVLERIL